MQRATKSLKIEPVSGQLVLIEPLVTDEGLKQELKEKIGGQDFVLADYTDELIMRGRAANNQSTPGAIGILGAGFPSGGTFPYPEPQI